GRSLAGLAVRVLRGRTSARALAVGAAGLLLRCAGAAASWAAAYYVAVALGPSQPIFWSVAVQRTLQAAWALAVDSVVLPDGAKRVPEKA
ncbi:MAG TPA: hypothetical protein VJB16_02475, partial [archaeon]|nr:hypothetical protein [archaeon]